MKRPFRENVTLPVDSNLLKQLGTVEDLLADHRWTEAIASLQQIAQTESRALVLVQPGTTGGVATYVNAATRCSVLLSHIPVEGRQAYRQKVDSQARRWYENWQRTGDDAELLRIVRQTFLSSYGDDALLALGEAAFDRADFSAAHVWWEQLIPLPDDAPASDFPTVLRYPDAEIDRPSILARMILCTILQGEQVRAADQLLQFSTLYPLSTGKLAGQQGQLVELIQQILDDSRHWKRLAPLAEVATLGMSAARFQAIPETVDIGALQWSHPLVPDRLTRQNQGFPFQKDPLSFFPVVYNNIVLVNDAEAIRAWNILSGEPAWPSVANDPAVVYPSIQDEAPASPDKICVGVPFHTMTIEGGRLYARMGSSVTSPANTELRTQASDLVCLDLTQEGKLVWQLTAQELIRDDHPWRFEGTPIIVAGRAYVVLCRRRPQLELLVACLNADDGRLLWQRSAGAFRVSVEDHHNRVSHLLLTAGGGRIFLSSDVGAIVALNADDGRLEWALSYESRAEDSSSVLSDPGRIGLLPGLFHAGLLFVAPNDADFALCIEADSGRVRWKFPYQSATGGEAPDQLRRDRAAGKRRDLGWRSLLGVVPGGSGGLLIVSGNFLCAIDIENGTQAWRQNLSGSFGRGLIAGDQILVPKREAIDVFEQSTGQLIRTVPLRTPETAQQGGNLTLAGGMLLVAQPNRLTAYCEYSRLKERIEQELIWQPDASDWRLRLAELEATHGSVESAVAEYRQVLEQAGVNDFVRSTAQKKLGKLLQETGAKAFQDADFSAARDYWIQAATVTDDGKRRAELIFDVVRADESLGELAAALLELQRLLDDEQLAFVRRDQMTVGQEATKEMERLLTTYGRETYHQIESIAEAEFLQLSKTPSQSPLRRFVERFPQSKTAIAARELLVRVHRSAGEISEAYAILNEQRIGAIDDHGVVNTTLAIIRLLETKGYTDSAARWWWALTELDPAIKVTDEGTTRLLGELMRTRQKPVPAEQPVWTEVKRTWTAALPHGALISFPNSNAPSERVAAVLVSIPPETPRDTWHWRCLDWQNGQTRWEISATTPISIVDWTPVHLLIGTKFGWQARAPEDGRLVWEQRSTTPSTPQWRVQATSSSRETPWYETPWPGSFDVEHGLRLFDPDNGHLLAALKPNGHLHSVMSFDMTAAYMQTMKPTRTWIAAAAAPRGDWTYHEIHSGGELWRQPPIRLGRSIIETNFGHQVTGQFLGDIPSIVNQIEAQSWQDRVHAKGVEIVAEGGNSTRWEKQDFAAAQAMPFTWTAKNRLFVTVDGSRLMSLDPQTGQRRWSTELADYPLQSPATQVCVQGDLVFAASRGTLRSVSLSDGKVCWERYLGDTSSQWQTSVVQQGLFTTLDDPPHTMIASWPLKDSTPSDISIVLCDAATGRIAQKLHVDQAPRALLIDRRGQGVLWTETRLTGLTRLK